jgi:hypothetical protein
MIRFQRFLEYLSGHKEACRIGAQLHREGADLHRAFGALIVYVEGRSIADKRKKSSKQLRGIVNLGVRQHGVSPEVGRWILDRAELAYATNGLGLLHNIDSLAWLQLYLERVASRRVTMSEIAYLVEAANYALDRKPTYVDPNTIGHELRRHRQKNPRFIQILKADISRNL